MKLKNENGVMVRTSNPAEIAMAQHLMREGYSVYRRGWPDFLAVKPGERPRWIEVKSGRYAEFSVNQWRVAEILKKAYGIEVELWKPEREGFLKKTA